MKNTTFSFIYYRLVGKETFLPIVNCDFLQTRQRDLQRITPRNNTMNVTIEYSPISLGKLRLVLHVQTAITNLKNIGISDKDVDEVKGIFADTNIYLLSGTFFIAGVHVSALCQSASNREIYMRDEDMTFAPQNLKKNLRTSCVIVVIRFPRH